MPDPYGEESRYYATCLDNDEARALLVQAIDAGNPLLPLVERAATHIGNLQDKIQYCRSRGDFCECACACNYDDPGDVCRVHAGQHRSANLADDASVRSTPTEGST